MAKKLTLTDLDFSRAGNTPDWAVQLRQDYENQQNKEREVAAQVDAIVKDYESRGEPLNDNEIASLFQAMTNGEDWTRPANFEGTVGGVSSTEEDYVEPEPPKGYWESRMDDARQNIDEIGTFAKNTLGNLEQSGAGGAAILADYGDALQAAPAILPGVNLAGQLGSRYKDQLLDLNKTLQERSTTNLEEAQAELEAMKENHPDWLVDTIADVTGTPSSVASIPGGPFAIIPGADVFLGEYGQARAAGLSPDESLASAALQGGIETGVSAIPSHKLVSRLPFVGPAVKKFEKGVADSLESRIGQVLNTSTRAALTATGEGLEEGATGIAQDAAYRLQGLLGPEKAAEYAQSQVIDDKDYWQNIWRQARAGFVMGGGIGGIEASFSGAKQGAAMRQEREAGLDSSINTNLGNELLAQRTDADLADLRADTETTQDIAFEEQRIANEEAKRQAFEQAEKTTAEQKGLEEEAGFQTLERANTPAATVVERTGRAGLADVVERVPAEPVRPEDVAEQRAAEQRAADEQAERAKQGKLAEELRKRREAAQKAQDKEQKKQTRAQRLAEKKRRDFIADQVLSENPDATEAELTEEYERRLADETIQPPEKATTKTEPTLEDRVQRVRDNLERAQKSKVSRMQTERIKSVVRRNPDLSVEEIAGQLRQEGQVGVVPEAQPIVQPTGDTPAPANVIPAPTKTDKSQTEAELDNFAEKMGLSLGMAAEPVQGSTVSTIKDFAPKAKTFVKALAGRTSKDSRDVQTLIHQGKIIVAPNAATLGRQEAGRQAEYDMGTGKMYLYLDNMADLNDPVGHIAAALHETNHALLTEGEIGAAAGKIRTAANKGNTLAKNAVRKAQADTDARGGDTTFENEEVVAYFASETKAAEGKPLGSVGAVVRDLTSAAKGAIRKHTGLDLNVSIGEVATALNAALGDATTREITGRGQAGQLGTLAGRGSTGFAEADAQGRTFTPSSDVVGGARFEFDDSGAEISNDASTWEAIANGETVPLSDVFVSDEHWKQYPELMDNLKVKVDPNMDPGTHGAYANGTVFVPPTVARVHARDPEDLRNTFLHEIQHAIQEKEGFVPGTNKDNFIPTALTEMKKLDAERVDRLARDFEYGAAVKGLKPADRAKWDGLVQSMPGLSPEQTNAMFIQEGYHNKTSDRNAQRQGNRYLQAQENLKKTNAEYREAEKRALRIYARDRGEAEARNVEARSRMTQEERDALPFESTIGQDIGATPDELLDTTPFVGRPERAPVASESLGMASSQTPEAKAERRDPTVVKWQTWARNLFQNSKGLGPQILEAFEHAKSSPAGEEARANNSLGKYNDALRQMAKQQGTSMDAISEQIMKDLDAIDNQTNGYDANIAAYKAVTAKYGEAGRHLLDLRNQVDALTKEMLRQRAAANVKPTAAEAKQLTTLINNSGRYSHRLYAAYQGKAGKKYANAIMDVYDKGRKGKKLTPAQKDTYDMVERALKTLIDDSLMIPDDAAIAEMGGDQLIRLYKTWGDNLPKSMSLDGMRDELADKRDAINGDTDRLRVTAEEIASDLLDLTNSDQPIATYFRGGKQDRGILQERAKIPANIRALMGEITDPGTRLLATVAKQAEFVARTKFLLEIKNKIDPSHLQPPNATGTPAVVNNAMQKLEGEGYGPLDGWYASPQLRSMLVDVRESLANFEQVTAMAGSDPGKLTSAAVDKGLEKWMQLAGISKRAQIVGNLFLQPLNWAGALFMPLVNGNINLATYGRGLQDAVNLIRYARNPSLGLRSASDAVTYGITDSATIGELKGLPYEKIQDFARTMAGKSPSKALRFLKDAGLTLQESYAMMDVWAKIANFHNEVNQLTSYYKKNGETRTEEQIKREAADITNRTNITYKRAVPVIKALERGGITNFGTYFYEVFRSQVGNFAQGVKEMTVDVSNASTPSAKAAKLQRGMSRVGGQTAYWTAAAQLSSMLSSLMFGDDDDEWDKRALLPEYMQNQDLYTVGLDENGIPVLFSVSRVDAIGPATDIMRQAMIGGLNAEQAKDELLNLYVRPRIAPQLYNLGKTLIQDTAPTKEPVIQHLTPEGYEYLLKGTRAVGVQDKSTKAWVNLVEAAFGPGTYMAYRGNNPAPVAPTEGGEGVQQVALMAKYIGATFVKADPDSTVFFANKDYQDTIKTGRKDLANAFKDRPNITDDEIVSFVNEAKDAEEAKWNELARVYRGMRAVGMRQTDIDKILKNAKIDGATITSLKNQKFNSKAVSKQSFEQQINQELSKLNDKDKKAFKKEWEKAWKRLDTVNKEGKR